MLIIQNPRDVLSFNYENVCWMMNIDQEQAWNDIKYLPSIVNGQNRSLIVQQEQQLLFLAKPQEKVLFTHEPDHQFLSYLIKQGCELPDIFVNREKKFSFYPVLENALLVPYIQSEEIEILKKNSLNLEVYGCSLELSKQLNNKYNVRKLMLSHEVKVTRGIFCNNIQDLKSAYETLKLEGFKKCVIKVPYGSSGKGLYVISNESSFQNTVSFIARREEKFELLIEGWHPVNKSINCQLLINDDEVSILAITEQVINEYGDYLGTIFTPEYPKHLIDKYKFEVLKVGRILRNMNYKGILGIDSIIDMNDNVYPVIEINARFTQVTYLLPIVKRFMAKYKYIESRRIQFEESCNRSFSEIKDQIYDSFSDSYYKEIFIYTFGRINLKDKFIYRIYVLFLK